ncbi:MAG: type II toxin-antitoxin system VapC family toxin [Gammaproteobacteria bacterium]
MSNELLLDTGGLVCLLDRSQRRHAEFVAFYEAWSGEVVSTEAVLTEATHLLGRVSGGATACLDFFLAGGAILVPSSLQSLGRARALMQKFQNLPMDYADATLVVLAEDLDTGLVLSTDRRDFSVYRRNRRQRFDIRP